VDPVDQDLDPEHWFWGLPDPHPEPLDIGEDPDPHLDPYKNVTNPRHWCKYCVLFRRCARTIVRTRLCWPA
jgi:hypothetical protein